MAGIMHLLPCQKNIKEKNETILFNLGKSTSIKITIAERSVCMPNVPDLRRFLQSNISNPIKAKMC